jgi:DNA polymerase I-like protein with 3'-5' exonuclease and polymerase domains
MPKYRSTPDAMRLWVEGAEALSLVEAAGVRVDKGYLDQVMVTTSEQIRDAEKQITSDPDFRHWRKRFGEKTKPTSYDQLAAVVFRDLGFASKMRTASGTRESAAEEAFEGIDVPLVETFLRAAKLRKAYDTYLTGIQREVVQHPDGDWYVHPCYNLNTVISFRSSCSDPNWTNIPNRNPELAEIIRRCYIPRRGRQIGEIDEGQIEVRVPTAYHHDPVLIEYCNDPSKDMHRDMAAQIYKLKPSQVSKALRTLVKGFYVFATFYGSYYINTAVDLWNDIDLHQVKIEGENRTVRQHLTDIGFTELGECDPREKPKKGTWEHHIREIDQDFWGRRFQVYAGWKERWWEACQRDGGFQLLTGFAVNTPLDKRQATNIPVQGAAFHILLWSLIQVVRKLKRYKMESLVIGEIHDCLNFDLHPRERDDVLSLAVDTMTRDVVREFATWMPVSLVAEAEICPIGESWFAKSQVVWQGSSWKPAAPEKWEKRYGPWSLQEV